MEYMTVPEAVQATGYSKSGIHNFIRAGKIEGLQKFGRDYQIPVEWVQTHIKPQTVTEIAAAKGVTRQSLYQHKYRKKSKQVKSKQVLTD